MKLDTAVQFVHPQTQAQRNRVRKSKHFRCSKVLTLSSKMRALRSCQTNHNIVCDIKYYYLNNDYYHC